MSPLVPVLMLAPLLLSGAGPLAAGPPFLGFEQGREGQVAADAAAARYREITTANELAAAQARLQADQAVSSLRAARANAVLAPAAGGSGAPLPVIDTSRLISIPDDALAQSNARVRAAAANRR